MVKELGRLYSELEANEGKSGLGLHARSGLAACGPVEYAVYAAVRFAPHPRSAGRGANWARGQR